MARSCLVLNWTHGLLRLREESRFSYHCLHRYQEGGTLDLRSNPLDLSPFEDVAEEQPRLVDVVSNKPTQVVRTLRLPTSQWHDGLPAHLGSPIVGARLQTFQLAWLQTSADRWIRNLVLKGYKIEFDCLPPLRFFKTGLPLSDDKRAVLQIAIQSLLDSAVLIPVPVHPQGQGYYSSLFVVPKPDGSVRPILNLKGLNRYVTYYRFKMESLRSVIAGLEPKEFMIALDLKDAYLHIPIWQPHQRFLRFAIRQNHYQFQALPFGLSSAPRVFTKVMSVMIAHLGSLGVTIVPYLDDLLIKAPSQQMLLQHALLTYNVLVHHGWIVNFKKSHLIPSQRLQFLGMIFDTVNQRIYLPQQKVQILRHLVQLVLKPRTVSVHLCIRLLGTMVAAFEALQFGRFHSRPFQLDVLAQWSGSHLQIHHRVRLSPRARVSALVAQGTQFNRRETVRRLELDNSNDGRQSQRLGSCSSKLSAPGSLGGSRKIAVYKCPGTPRNLQCATTSSAHASVSHCPGAVRQCDSGRIHQQTRRNKKPHGNAGSSLNPQLGGIPPGDIVGSVHSGSGQLGSGLSQSSGFSSRRMGIKSRSVSHVGSAVGLSSGGPDGVSTQSPNAPVCVQNEGSKGSGGGCSHRRVAVQPCESVSTVSVAPSGAKTDQKSLSQSY
ncbi:uncharacterized protein LOC134981181 [Pseudophryne corroboree]|uniref:uncharacterized protein LOC134981181 n=1 Tax=Pseudophryne corroboree TaxID=495146 RepID=UPI003081FC89